MPTDHHPPTAEEILRQMHTDLARELGACQLLLQTSDEILIRDFGPLDRPGDWIIVGEAVRSAKAYMALLLLCEQGFGEQAAILARTLFESLLVIMWTTHNREEAQERFDRHAGYFRTVQAERASKYYWRTPWEPPTPLDPEVRRRMERDFGREANLLWTGHKSLRTLFDEVHPLWPDKWIQGQMRQHFDVVLAAESSYVHSTAYGVFGTMRMLEDQKMIVFDLGRSEREVRNSLQSGSGLFEYVLHWANTAWGGAKS